MLTSPAVPVIVEPFVEGQITGTFDINMQTLPEQYFDADGHAWAATDWKIRDVASQTIVWQLPFSSFPPLTLYRVDFSDGQFVGSLAGRTELEYDTAYQLIVRYRDSNGEISADAVRGFTTTAATVPVPGGGQWLIRPGYSLDVVQSGLRLPVNVAFVPNPGPNPSDPLYYVSELYGSIQVVRRDGTRSTFATGLLDYNPQGPISGTGEQGLTGLAVERDSTNPDIYRLYVGMLWDNGSPPGSPNHYPKVERLDSAIGGLTLAGRTVLLNMQPETQGQSHIISNLTLGPDGKLYVHMGDGFNAATALNLDQYRGKILRMNKDGTPVATGDPSGANPFYNLANGINARDYVYTYGHRNPFGGAWQPGTNRHWIVENGNSLDRMVDLTAGTSYGWSGSDTAISTFSKYVWNPATAPVNMSFIDATIQGGSMFPSSTYGHAYVTLSGSTYAAGPLERSKGIVEFPDLTTLDGGGKLAVPPSFLVKYNGTGRGTTAALAPGPDGLYFSDLYEDTGANGATAPGASLYRIRYVGDTGGQPPTIAIPAAANPPVIVLGNVSQLSVLGADDGGEPELSYTWGVLGSPSGPVTFTVNGVNAAKNTTATFLANGSYTIFVAVRDLAGQTAISTTTITVSSVLSDTGNGITGRYFDEINFTSLFETRVDPMVDFDWGSGAPVAGMGTNTFSVRWEGYVVPRFSEIYTFTTTTDDGARLWVGNLATPLIDEWFDHGAASFSGAVALSANQIYPIRFDYYENGGAASARLEWASPGQIREVVPQGRLHTVIPTSPLPPEDLRLSSPSPHRMDLDWTDVSPNESGFKIERGTNGFNFTLVGVVGANVTSFQDTGLSAGTRYFYRLRSTNPGGDSTFVSGTQVTALVGDFNGDLVLNLVDLDALVAAIAGGGHPSAFDLTMDGQVDLLDRDAWLAVAGALNLPSQNPYRLGDANLDGVVDGSDFGVWNSHKFTTAAAWSAGDFNADGVVDGSDFGIWNGNKFTSSDRASSHEGPIPIRDARLGISQSRMSSEGTGTWRRKLALSPWAGLLPDPTPSSPADVEASQNRPGGRRSPGQVS
ncbi:MAG TPA: PQQ-dependent sugar dehydrogenase [Pirellulaceae bacterium]